MRRFRFVATFFLIALVVGCAGSRKKHSEVLVRSQRVQMALGDIAKALAQYQSDNGYFPKGLATLRDEAYVRIMPDVEQEWTLKYYTDGDRVMMVEAISRPSMPDGEGHKITYRVPEEAWEGYGITEFP